MQCCATRHFLTNLSAYAKWQLKARFAQMRIHDLHNANAILSLSMSLTKACLATQTAGSVEVVALRSMIWLQEVQGFLGSTVCAKCVAISTLPAYFQALLYIYIMLIAAPFQLLLPSAAIYI